MKCFIKYLLLFFFVSNYYIYAELTLEDKVEIKKLMKEAIAEYFEEKNKREKSNYFTAGLLITGELNFSQVNSYNNQGKAYYIGGFSDYIFLNKALLFGIEFGFNDNTILVTKEDNNSFIPIKFNETAKAIFLGLNTAFIFNEILYIGINTTIFSELIHFSDLNNSKNDLPTKNDISLAIELGPMLNFKDKIQIKPLLKMGIILGSGRPLFAFNLNLGYIF